MKFDPPLVSGTLVQRYKRFLFDAILDDGSAITGSCPNTGSMRGLTAPGSRIWMSTSDSPTRKHRHRLELVEADGMIVGINTGLPNRLAEEAIRWWNARGNTAAIRASTSCSPVRTGRRPMSRSKNVHFRRTPGLAEFPDTVTERGAKHLEELGDMAEAGCRAVMLYLIQREDCARFRVCADLDPTYATGFRRALARGVEAYAVKCVVTPFQIQPVASIAMDEPGAAVL